MILFDESEGSYSALLGSMVVKDSKKEMFERLARKAISFKDRYQLISKKTGVPWDVIAVIHCRESNFNFNTHLHNGDSLNNRTHHVPAGRPSLGNPPFTFEESAIDALKMKNLHKIVDWSPERECYELERYNGFGYRMHHSSVLSPYLWAGTNHYSAGKYVSDGNFDGNFVDPQPGAIPLLVTIRRLDHSPEKIVKTSRKLSLLKKLRLTIVSVFGSLFTADWFNVGVSYLNQIKEFASDHKMMLIIGAAVTAWLVFKLIESWSLEDYKNGKYTPSKMETE